MNEKIKRANDIIDHALEDLAEALKQGKSESLRNYLRAMARFHRYSTRNVLLIVSQCPQATHVAGFYAWKNLGRFVRKGEKGILIVAPMAIRSDVDEERSDRESEDAAIVRFRATHVFDISQTEGEALPEPQSAMGEPGQHLAALKAFVLAQGLALEYEPGFFAQGASAPGCITLREGLPAAEEFSTLVHELAHDILHRRTGRVHALSKAAKETEAEAVAFVVCEAVGLQAKGAAADYIQNWEGDAETLAASLELIQETARFILEGLKVGEESPTLGKAA